jgi:hypothetical protein
MYKECAAGPSSKVNKHGFYEKKVPEKKRLSQENKCTKLSWNISRAVSLGIPIS